MNGEHLSSLCDSSESQMQNDHGNQSAATHGWDSPTHITQGFSRGTLCSPLHGQHFIEEKWRLGEAWDLL